jgi:hypothetical protein
MLFKKKSTSPLNKWQEVLFYVISGATEAGQKFCNGISSMNATLKRDVHL